MAYTIYNTDGSVLLTLGEGKTDSITTSLTLIGKNVSGYGEVLNNNLVKMMSHFSGTSEPNGPVVGQIWYDTATGRVKVYDLNQIFRPITNTITAPYKPTNLVPQDYWFDSENHQLFFTIDGSTLYNIGPVSSSKFGNSGWVSETVLDQSTNPHSVTKLYSNNELVGIMSTSSFTLLASTSGMTTVGIGFNLNTAITGIRFIGTATSADSISGISSNQFLRSDINTSTQGSLTINNDNGLRVLNSTFDDIVLYADPTSHVGTLAYNPSSYDFRVQVAHPTLGLSSALYMKSTNLGVGVWNESPQYPLDVVGDTRIQGNLIVEGTTTNITSVNMQVNDINIELGYGVTTDGDASGGGITLHGTTDHTIKWIDTNTGWNSSDHINLSTGSAYKIEGQAVLYKSSLAPGVTSAPGLTSVGSLINLNVGNIVLAGNLITVNNNGNLNLSGSGAGTVDVQNNRVTTVGTPIDDTDAAHKKYVDDALYLSRSNLLSLTVDVTHFANTSSEIQAILDLVYPVVNPPADRLFDLPDGTRANVLCGTTYIRTTTATVAVTFATETVDKNNVVNAATVVSGLAGSIAARLPSQVYSPITTYTVQTWKVQAGVWTQQ